MLSRLVGAVPLHVAVLTPGEAVTLLGRLAGPARTAADRQLVESVTPGRYGLHGLLRLYARDQQVPSGTSSPGRTRLPGHGVAVVRADLPRRPAHPGAYFATQEDALDWMERERANLVAAVDQAAEAYAHRDLGVARTAGHHLDRRTGPAGGRRCASSAGCTG
ncbi:MAG: hypothetical protein ACJ73S_10995 [Mycobacteriales bacterium]